MWCSGMENETAAKRLRKLWEARRKMSAETVENWKDGTERRSLPIHVLNYMDDRLQTHSDNIEKLLKDHVSEEAIRFDSLEDKINDNDKLAQSRHGALIASINSYMSKQETFEHAFLRTTDGKPDVHGHYTDHESRFKSGQWWSGVKQSTIAELIKWASILIIAWMAVMTWKEFLKGPQ